MDFRQYQNRAEDFSKFLSKKGRDRQLAAALGIASEAGETVNEIKKVAFFDKPLDLPKIIEEIGDTLWGLAELCSSLDISLDVCATLNLQKLADRHGDGFKPYGEQKR